MKPGYKQTEVGVIPEDWEVQKIRDLCKLVNGRGFKPYEWGARGYPIIRIQNLNGSDEFNFYEGPFNPKILVEPGQLLFAWSGSRGTSFGPHVWHGETAVLNYHTWKIEIDENAVYPDFYLYALRNLTKSIEDQAHGASALVHTQKWEMEGFDLAIPCEIDEQRAIAAALSDVDAALAGILRLIAKKRDLKQAAMQTLLSGQTRLPGFSEEWELKRLGDFGATYGGLTGKTKSDFGAGSGEYITFMNVMTNIVIDRETFDRVIVGPKEVQNLVRCGDLIFNGSSETADEVAMCAYVPFDSPNLYLNSFCFGFRATKDEIDGLFMAYVFRSHVGREIVKLLAQGSTRINISKRSLLKAELRLPEKTEQTAIAAVLSDMDTEIAALTEQAEKTRLIKEAMMQELLTGRTRLPILEEAHA